MSYPVFSSGSQVDIARAVRQHGMIWVRGNARQTVRRMAKQGLVNFNAEVITDTNSSRSHEAFCVYESAKVRRSHEP